MTNINRWLPLIYLLTFLLIRNESISGQDRLSGKKFATRSEVMTVNGMAATNHPIATQVALEILKKGGTAVDAAIAANAFLGFADPAMNGIGGDLFAIVWNADEKKLYGLNGSGKSPQSLSKNYFSSRNMRTISPAGPLPVTVPGCVDAWFELHRKFGKLPVKQLLQPTIDYARQGIPTAPEVADMMAYLERNLLPSYSADGDISFEDFPEFCKVYRKDGHFPIKGDIFTNPDLANTLQKIATDGRDAFYKGHIATEIAAYMKDHGGFLSNKDFAAHSSDWIDPVSTNYRGFDIWELPPNGQGISVLQMLNILEKYNMTKYGFGSVEHIHYFAEAKKLTYADRAKYYGDPNVNNLPVETLISKDYAERRRQLISDNHKGNYGPGLEDDNHTIYLTVADKDGNMVSLIQSNSWLFGSLVVVPGLGFALQNRGTGFRLEPNHVNSYAPGKRPFHTIIPAFITHNGEPFVSFGLTGGGMQPQGHVQIVMNLIDFGMNLQEAGDAPRLRHEYIDGAEVISAESGLDYEVIRELMKMGHTVAFGFERFGGYQAIMLKNGVYYGASESRKDGHAAGY
ncbi:MAG: gamma-glutamyltransferase [Saprospiraceae bacterium]|nr:gamma-glutamyltransferase [Saprospiraceae bacterium]